MQVVNITGGKLTIPIYQYCSNEKYVSFEAYLDPSSSLGITSVSLILNNGTLMAIPMNFSPKYVSLYINCSLPVYGVYLNIGTYPPYPMEALIIPGPNVTYSLTQGSKNITIPTMPGLEYLFSLIKIVLISPATATISDYLTVPLSVEYSTVNIGSLNANAKITTYITYSNNVEVTANGTIYVIVMPYYYMPISNTQNYIVSSIAEPIIMLTGASWINYSIENCSIISPGIPRITPWTKYLRYSPSCSINMTIKPVTIKLTDASLQRLSCSNVLLAMQGGTMIGISGNVTINPIANRVIYLVINGMRTIPIYLNSIPTSVITIQLPIITRQEISILDELGEPINPILYININGTLLLFTNNTCILPGKYNIYALVNNQLLNLGMENMNQGSLLKVPLFPNYTITISSLQKCPGLGLELIVKYGNQEYVIPFNGNSQQVNLMNVLPSSYVQIYLLGNGTILYRYRVLINNTTAHVILSPRIINFIPVDLLGNELPNAILSIGNLYYVGPGKYCVPVNSSLGMVMYGNEVYIVNLTKGNIYIRIWTLGTLGIKSLLIILALLTMLIAIMGILKGLSRRGGGGSEDYVIIK
ncbi:MAG: hypothetical protein TU36_003775 [Vulcanisaeta sp. AZ3]|jgi:hypothetical protein